MISGVDHLGSRLCIHELTTDEILEHFPNYTEKQKLRLAD